ncbi:PCNA-associated factor-like [Zerene cesonia]|uniref:PCNA-associated factor-like n=1 Tax=Zerene cesonia TaxID=33412 RepID=UPI0018E55882|nr:PCNA-associated factor-like [Zerene cesonia]
MARTKASVGAKVSAGKSSKARCSVAPPTSSSSSSGGEKSSRSYSGGNPVCPRETPKWQKPITNFFITNQGQKPCEDGEIAGSSKSKPKRNIIHSDDESDSEKSTNKSKEDQNESKEDQNESKEDQNKSKEDQNERIENEVESQEFECSQSYEHSPPKNRELDESIILEPLTGENSHKLEEYYTKDKGKGKGKKSKEDNNNRLSFKRQSEDMESPLPKKIRVN